MINITLVAGQWFSPITPVSDTKGVIRIRISKKNRKHNGQKKKYKRTNNDPLNIEIMAMVFNATFNNISVLNKMTTNVVFCFVYFAVAHN
jgi:hypothetical protein